MDELNDARVVELGEALYEKHKAALEEGANGKVVMFDVKSGDYFVGDDLRSVWEQARTAHPDGRFYSRRIGELDSLSPEVVE